VFEKIVELAFFRELERVLVVRGHEPGEALNYGGGSRPREDLMHEKICV
jgi:hypothetical protein